MQQRFIIVLVVLMLMLSGKNFAQEKQDGFPVLTTTQLKYTGIKISAITPDFYSRQLGIVCKKELIVEKKINVALRLRLGSLEYVNRMEGKKY